VVTPFVTQYLYLNTRPVQSSDRTHTLTVSGAWELPFGQGKPFLASSKLGNALLGGWVFTSLGSFFTGLPFSICCSSTSLTMVGASQRWTNLRSTERHRLRLYTRPLVRPRSFFRSTCSVHSIDRFGQSADTGGH